MMTKRRSALVAIVLVIAVCSLSTAVVAHSDGLGHSEANCTCQLCHIQHAAVPQPTAPVQVTVALQVVRYVAEEQLTAVATTLCIHSVPRAPPA
jgi:CxxC motif-containing protein (DUF1111 family)